MNEIIEKESIENLIYDVRGVQVMLSSDVAKLYQVETRRINEVIKRNINRFPDSFCFQINRNEYENLRSQFAISSSDNNYGGVRYLPYVLTEQGIMMLSGLLKSDVAVKVNIQIIDAFVKMRKYFVSSLTNNDILINHENRLLKIESVMDMFKEKKLDKLLFEGQIYDAYSVLLDIFNKSKKEIIIIDNYAGKELLDILKNIDKKIIIVSKNIEGVLKKKYESQYNNVMFINNNSFHDRFIVIDRIVLYTCGSSFKDLGKKCFAIHELEDKEYLNRLINLIIL